MDLTEEISLFLSERLPGTISLFNKGNVCAVCQLGWIHQGQEWAVQQERAEMDGSALGLGGGCCALLPGLSSSDLDEGYVIGLIFVSPT